MSLKYEPASEPLHILTDISGLSKQNVVQVVAHERPELEEEKNALVIQVLALPNPQP